MKGTAHRASTAHPAITFIGRLALAALILVVLVEVYFLARGSTCTAKRSRKPASTRWPHPSRAASRSRPSTSCRTCTCRPSWPWRIIGSTPIPLRCHRHGARLVNDLKAGAIVEGGSTITQQLAKNQYFTQEQTVERKIAEVFMALTMEQHFSKRTILELYVNSIYFGDGYEGIGSASWGYFGKAPSALDADECTLLAGIPNAPSVYALSQNPGLARERQQEVLRKLVSYDYLGRTQHSTFWETCARWPHDAPSH